MTRKRYVKLLMGHGYSRNTANYCAERALARGETYQQNYNTMLVGIRMAKGVREMAKTLANAFAAMSVEIKKMRDGFVELGERIRAAMDKEKGPGA